MKKQKIKGRLYTDIKIINNLNRYVNIATEEERKEGLEWYAQANQFCRLMSDMYGVTIEQAAGITSAFSPQASWTSNKLFVKSFLESKGKAVVTTYDRVAKAKKILKTTDYQAIMNLLSTTEDGAKKTKAFYDSILRPNDTNLVVIDRHQIAASFQRPDSTSAIDSNMAKLTAIQYDFLSDCTREVARDAGLPVSGIQGLIWVVYRRCRDLFQHKPNEFELPQLMTENPF